MNSWVYEGFDKTYNSLGIEFDKNYYESNTYLKGKKIRNPDFSYPNISTFRPENKFERNQIFQKICEKLTA